MSGEQSKSYQTIKDWETGNQCLLTLSREHTDLTGKEINPAIPAIPAIPSNKMAFKSKERENVLSIQNCPALRHFRIRELGDI